MFLCGTNPVERGRASALFFISWTTHGRGPAELAAGCPGPCSDWLEMQSTNYYHTFIEVADDCPATEGEAPPRRAEKTVANVHYDMLAGNPYRYTSDEVIFEAHRQKNRIGEDAVPAERVRFFSKGQACLRSSPLAKRYGWGMHSDSEGKVAIYSLGSEEYAMYANDPALKHLKAMRSRRRQTAR